MMRGLRLPPRIKVLEALGAIADGRITRIGGPCYRVVSSDGSREYTVYVDVERRIVYSDDNGTRFRGYTGYPIIAALMLSHVLPFNKRVAEGLKGVKWRELNEKYRRYSVVEEIVKARAAERGVRREELESLVASVMASLRGMRLKLIDTFREDMCRSGGTGLSRWLGAGDERAGNEPRAEAPAAPHEASA